MLDSPYVRRVAISLQCLGLPFVHRSVSVFRGFDQFKAINPVVKAPTLVCDDGTVLMGSTRILDHAESLVEPARRLMPADPAARLRALHSLGLALAALDKSVPPRLRLRPFQPVDHAVYAAMCADPQVMCHIGEGRPQTADEAWRAMATMLGHWQLRGYGMWALKLKDTGELLGRAGFHNPSDWPGFEIGWLLAREHWGRGFAHEAAEAALDMAFHTLGRATAISLIRPDNVRSMRLAEALGAVRTERIAFLVGDAWVYRHAKAAQRAPQQS